MFRGEHPEQEADNRDKMGDDLVPVPVRGFDTQEDGVTCHGRREDMAVVEVGERVEETSSRGQKHRIEERVGLDSRVAGRHLGALDSPSVS